MSTNKNDPERLDRLANSAQNSLPWISGGVVLFWTLWLAIDIESIGALEPLFSALAFLGVLVTLLLQRHELVLQREQLVLQREELKSTRLELAGQKAQMEAQNRTLALQRFENTFFQMISLHHQIVDSMKDGQIKGRGVIENAYGHFTSYYETHYGRAANPDAEKISGAFDEMWKQDGRKLEHYFRHLHILIDFVEKSDVGTEAKQFYYAVIISQLSGTEQLFCFYNSISKQGRYSIELFDRTQILRFMPRERLLDKNHQSLFRLTAFERD